MLIKYEHQEIHLKCNKLYCTVISKKASKDRLSAITYKHAGSQCQCPSYTAEFLSPDWLQAIRHLNEDQKVLHSVVTYKWKDGPSIKTEINEFTTGTHKIDRFE